MAVCKVQILTCILWVTIPTGRETWLRTMTVWVRIPGDPPFNTGVLKQAIRLNTQPLERAKQILCLCAANPIGRGAWLKTKLFRVRIPGGAPVYMLGFVQW